MTEHVGALIAEARDYANRRTGTVPGDLVLRLVIELETAAAERDAAVRDLDAGFAESDHLSAKYYQRMRDAEALAQKANLSIIGLVRMANERADERDEALAVIAEVRAMLPGPRTYAESLMRDFAGNPWPQTINADEVARILSRIPEHPKED